VYQHISSSSTKKTEFKKEKKKREFEVFFDSIQILACLMAQTKTELFNFL
jgi:hypothetical protein